MSIHYDIDSINDRFADDFDELSKKNMMVIDGLSKIEESWSGSFAGYHGELYYRDFEKPPLDKQFSVEWGGLRGLPEGWEQKKSEDIEKKINMTLGDGFDIKEYKKLVDTKYKELEKCKHEMLLLIEGDVSSLEIENIDADIESLKNFNFARKHGEIINTFLPGKMMSRDSRAVMQGMMVPGHIYYKAVCMRAHEMTENFTEFIRLLETIQNRIRANKNNKSISVNYWNFVNPFWLIWTTIKVAWKNKIWTAIFGLLSILAYDYSSAWHNWKAFSSYIGMPFL